MDSEIDPTSNKYPRKSGRSLPQYVYGDGKNVQGSGRQAGTDGKQVKCGAAEVIRGESATVCGQQHFLTDIFVGLYNKTLVTRSVAMIRYDRRLFFGLSIFDRRNE